MSVFALTGRLFFLHRLTGARELPQACSPLTGGKFSAEPQRGDSPSADGGSVPRPAAGAKRKDNLRFSFLFELLPFPCFLIWRRFPICDRFEKEYGRGFLLPCFSQSVRRVRYITATQAVKFPQAQHDRVAQLFNTLYRTAPTRINYTRHLNSQMPCVTTCQGFARHGYVAPAQSKPPV